MKTGTAATRHRRASETLVSQLRTLKPVACKELQNCQHLVLRTITWSRESLVPRTRRSLHQERYDWAVVIMLSLDTKSTFIARLGT